MFSEMYKQNLKRFNHLGNHDLDESFLNLLATDYPEKFLVLLEFKFRIDSLNNYIEAYDITLDTFNPFKFKEHVDTISKIFK